MTITRRDFLNGTLLGAGAALLDLPAPALARAALPTAPPAGWYGYGGVGDYADSHGNTPEMVATAHALRDGRYDGLGPDDVHDTGEVFDVVVVGGGLAGLGAAYEFDKRRREGQRCLILENHPVFGGEAKRNEFMVGGERLIAPQGSNGFSIPGVDGGEHAAGDARYYDELGVPRTFDYREWPADRRPLRFGQDNYGFLYWLEERASVGYHFEAPAGAGEDPWVRDPWRHGLAGTPYSAGERAELLRWRTTLEVPYEGEDFRRWLDGMTYAEYLERHMGFSALPGRYAAPVLAGAVGLGSDVVSAYAAYAILFPGMLGYLPPEARDFDSFERHSFPGGNDGFARHFLKRLIPDAITGGRAFADIMNGRVSFAALDRPGQPVCMRLASTAVAVEHEGDPQRAEHVRVTYARDGRLHRARARAVVMASGAWVNKYVVRDLPGEHAHAMAQLHHAPFLVANVALRNWRFMYERGITAMRYDGDFGFSANIRRPMMIGDYRPPLDPDAPAVLSFYVPFTYPGRDVHAQVTAGRRELMSISYADYERRILGQLRHLFGDAFRAERDVAGVILNRWGHAYVVPTPGFYYGREGAPAPREVISRRFGRIAFGHSELRGNQHWGPAAEEGRRALLQVMDAL